VRAGICAAGGALLMLVAGCATAPDRADVIAGRLGMDAVKVAGAGFDHQAFMDADARSASVVHVYLEGDGVPWATRHRVSPDPTPRHPLGLYLAARDPGPSLLLGRPCYYGDAGVAPCRPWLWTSGRYSPTVVLSMVAALSRLLPPREDLRITLVGYSGGGALAMLMAERLPRVERVLTVAANLDIDAWTDVHGYTRLAGSLNPAGRDPLPERVRRIHLAGGRDERVPAELIRAAAARDPGAVVRVLPGFDHRCCWVEEWPRILRSAATDGAPGARR
jgi:pimeloyl-ACP methyl ester carboxylesterase